MRAGPQSPPGLSASGALLFSQCHATFVTAYQNWTQHSDKGLSHGQKEDNSLIRPGPAVLISWSKLVSRKHHTASLGVQKDAQISEHFCLRPWQSVPRQELCLHHLHQASAVLMDSFSYTVFQATLNFIPIFQDINNSKFGVMCVINSVTFTHPGY